MEHTVTVNVKALAAIQKLPLYEEYDDYKKIRIGSTLEVYALSRTDDDDYFLRLQHKTAPAFYLRADLFDFDTEAYKAEIEEENKKRELERLKEKQDLERKEFLEHYGWGDLRCKAAVAAMQGFIINGIDDTGSKENNMKYLVFASVQVATALVEELKATV